MEAALAKLDELLEHYEGLSDCVIEGQEMVDSLRELRSVLTAGN